MTQMRMQCLNPLSAGKSFQTNKMAVLDYTMSRLNPLSAGKSFQTQAKGGNGGGYGS